VVVSRPTRSASWESSPAKISHRAPKPDWLKIRPLAGETLVRLKKDLRAKDLFTVCEEARCPNLAECWNEGTATIMIMGGICTRGCRFCAVTTGNPGGALDLDEPENTARAVAAMAARYIVVTSVDRDDLPDSGASHFAATIQAIRSFSSETLVEVLIGDLAGRLESLNTIVSAQPDMLAHNVETCRRLTRRVRDKRASYEQSLELLRRVKDLNPSLPTKSSIMVGLGETEDEVLETMDDLRSVGVDALTVGQYLRPSQKHLAVADYIPPEQFQYYEHMGLLKGFKYVASGPLVRSSYKAGSFHRLAQLGRQNAITATANPFRVLTGTGSGPAKVTPAGEHDG